MKYKKPSDFKTISEYSKYIMQMADEKRNKRMEQLNLPILDNYVAEGKLIKEYNQICIPGEEECTVYKYVYNGQTIYTIRIFPYGDYGCTFLEAFSGETEIKINDFVKKNIVENAKKLRNLNLENLKIKKNINGEIIEFPATSLATEAVDKLIANIVNNKNDIIRAHIFQELINLGYEDDFRLSNFSKSSVEVDLICGLKKAYINSNNSSLDFYDDNETAKFDRDFSQDLEIIIKNSLGETSEAYKMFNAYLNNYNFVYNLEFLRILKKTSCANSLIETFYAELERAEKEVREYIAKNVNIDISLKQAYDVLPEKIKLEFARKIFGLEKTKDNILDNIVEVFQRKCKTKNGKKYTSSEIIVFLENMAAQQITNIILKNETEEQLKKPMKK